MIIIRTNVIMRPADVEKLRNDIEAQAKTNIIVLPAYCEAVYIPPDMDVKIKILGWRE